MKIREIERRIGDALRDVKVVDPHCHLDAARPAAASLADLVLYHHVWIELVSSGMGRFEVTNAGLPHELADPGMDPVERVRRALPHLPAIRNTTVGMLLRRLLRNLYDADLPSDEKALRKLADAVARSASDPAWPERVLAERCGIERAVSVEKAGGPRSARILAAHERLRLLAIADGKTGPRERLEEMARFLGGDVRTADDYRRFAVRLAAPAAGEAPVFVGAWLPPYLTPELADDRNVTRILGKAREGEPLSHAELGSVPFFGMRCALEELRRSGPRVVQVIVGSEVLPPHRAITHWSGAFCGALARLAGLFEDFRFSLSVASDLYTQDSAILAKHVPNISVAGYWWHTLYPRHIRKAIETRLDIVPAGKIVAFFSDAYSCEWCLPKLLLVKQVFSEVLVERVAKGWYDMDTALWVVRTVFHDAPKAIYGI